MLYRLQEWLPDHPAHLNPGAITALNVYPRAKSYGPIAALANFSGALTGGANRGASFMRDADGDVNCFAGTATTLERLDSSLVGVWEDVSKAGGYTVPAGDLWSFATFGQRVIACNLDVAAQSYVVGSSTDFADLAAAAPKAKVAGVVNDFLVLGNTWDSTDTYRPNRIWWSAINDPTTWPTIGSVTAAQVQSDRQDFPDGGGVQAIVGGLLGADGVIIQERSVRRATYVGPPTVFTFSEVQGARGTTAPNSVIRVGGVCYYYGVDGFCAFDGVNTIPIGDERVNDYFIRTIAGTAYLPLMTATYDPKKAIVIWAYHTSASTGNPDRQIIYSPRANKWSEAAFSCETLVNNGAFFGYTLEELDSISSSLDSLAFSLDSVVWKRGDTAPSAFDTSHQLSFFTGSNLAATVDTGEFAREDGYRIIVEGLRPIVDGGTVTAALLWRDTPQASLTTNTATSVGADGVCPQRQSCRYGRGRISVAAGGDWQHASGIEPDMAPEGLR